MASASSSEPAPKPEIAGESSEAVIANDQLLLHRGLKKAKKERGCTAKERISKMPPCTAGKRSSIYRGVTRHRWTGRYEAHLWDKTTWNQNQNKKGKQVYLGAYDDEEAAARAYDLAALKYWGPGTLINFPVTDYTRDLDEMQNVSREEYLASLRRKSSGFSRGISKYRGLSSRWDASFGRVAGSEYFSSMNYNSDDPAAESEYVGSFGVERKIDLTSYIKWWGSSKSRQLESIPRSSEEIKHGIAEDIGSELKTMEWAVHHTEPYQMPRLGISLEAKRQQGSTVSCLNILSRSAAYKSLEEKASKRQASSNENDENENKNVNKLEYGKGVDKPASHGGNTEKLGAPLGVSGLSLQRNLYPFTSFLSTPHITNYNAIDPLDPILWTSLVPVLPSGLSRNSEVTKTEASSTYTYFRPEEE